MGQKILQVLGKTAFLTRQAGCGWLLAGLRDLADLLLTYINYPPLTIEIEGLRLSGYLRHRSFLHGLSTGSYEVFTRELFEKALKPGITVVDAGAHIGLYSLLAARHLQGNGKIFALEPDLYNFRALNFNVAENHAANVNPIRKAVSDTVGHAIFYRSPGTIGSSLVKRIDIGSYEEIQIETTNLDYELKDLRTESLLIKLDIEGAEIKALRGMYNILQVPREVILINEINPSALAHEGITPHAMISVLQSFSFRVWFIDDLHRQLIPVESTTMLRKGNLYCTRGC